MWGAVFTLFLFSLQEQFPEKLNHLGQRFSTAGMRPGTGT